MQSGRVFHADCEYVIDFEIEAEMKELELFKGTFLQTFRGCHKKLGAKFKNPLPTKCFIFRELSNGTKFMALRHPYLEE